MDLIRAFVDRYALEMLVSAAAATAVVILTTIAWRLGRWIRVRTMVSRETALSPDEVAYLRGRDNAAVLASVAYLYASGTVALAPLEAMSVRPANAVVRVGRYSQLVVAAALPQRHSPLDAAVHTALQWRPGLQIGDLVGAPVVQAGVRATEQRLRTAGYLPSGGGVVRGVVRTFLQLLVLGVLGCGVILRVAYRDGRDDTSYAQIGGGIIAVFILVSLFLFLAATAVVSKPMLSARGEAALESMNKRVPPALQSAAWATVGAFTAAFVVALYGSDAVWQADPAFASSAGVKTPASGGSDSSGSCSGGSSCGGSSCGGGCGGD